MYVCFDLKAVAGFVCSVNKESTMKTSMENLSQRLALQHITFVWWVIIQNLLMQLLTYIKILSVSYEIALVQMF